MNKSKIICTFLLLALAAGFMPCVSAADNTGDTDNAVYKVTFDGDSSKYSLMEGAALTDSIDGKALKLDGSKKQYVRLENDITEKLDGDYSISVDVYPEDEASFARVFDIGSGTDNFMYFTSYGGGVPKFRFKGDDLYSDGVMFNINEWNNIVITKQGGEARLYINGEVAATSTTFVHPLSHLGKTDKNYLGKSQYEHDAYFTGMIDNFAIYDYAIAEKDVKMANGGELQVKAGYKKGNEEIISFAHGDTVTAYAEVKNYKQQSENAKIVSIIHSAANGIRSVTESSTVTVNSGDTAVLNNNITIPEPVDLADSNLAYQIKTYIYTSCGGFEKISEITYGNTVVPSPLPEDTMETTIGVHDPSIFKDPKSGTYYVYSTGMIDIYKSNDLINWTKTTNTLPDLPNCVYDTYTHEDKSEYSNIWAPDMFYDESDTKTPYHLTCSYSDEFGKNNSSIILFKSASPEGPWENGEIIFTSKSDDAELGKVNAIDSNICIDHETGQKYMVYGSFWQGIHIKELNDDGTVKDPTTIGTRIMSRYRGIGGPEGAYIIYNEETGYYYLFSSYDSLSDTYQIRVARSKNITGPYFDQNGNSVDRFDDDESEANNTYGYKLMGSWQFPFGTTNYGPGHNSVLHDDDGTWYLVHHLRNVKGGFATLNVREMLWNETGWPVVTPERYNGETKTTASLVPGQWNVISIGDNTNAMLTSKPLNLGWGFTSFDKASGEAVLGDTIGTWEFNLVDNQLKLTFSDEVITGYVSTAWDSDANVPALQFTGTNQNNVTVWGKKAISSVVYK
ncbi:MAG: family 43 glycosylhydrolase [Hominilimicola sp.]